MNPLSNLLSAEILEALGWTLVHSLWQGFLIALVTGGIILLLRNHPARSRYLVYAGSLVLILMVTCGTFILAYQDAKIDNANPTVINTVNSLDGLGGLDSMGSMDGLDGMVGFLKENIERNAALLVMLWFIGMMIFFLKLLGGYIYVQRINYHFSPVFHNQFYIY